MTSYYNCNKTYVYHLVSSEVWHIIRAVRWYRHGVQKSYLHNTDNIEYLSACSVCIYSVFDTPINNCFHLISIRHKIQKTVTLFNM